MTERKRRSDAWDAPLTEEQRWEAYDKAKGMPWYELSAWLETEYGLHPGKNAVYAWMAYMRRQEGDYRLRRAIAAREEVKGLATAGGLDARTADAYMALANDAILGGDPDKGARLVEAAVRISAAAVRVKEQAMSEERLELQQKALDLQREKWEDAKARLDATTAALTDAEMTEEERLDSIRAIFGLGGTR